MNLSWHLYLMAGIYFLAGINHFRNPKMYLKIIPPYFSHPKGWNCITGVAEIILGIGLSIPFLSPWAAWGVIALLVAVFPTHIYMYFDKKASLGLPQWVLFLRMLLQFGLMYWAFQYT